MFLFGGRAPDDDASPPKRRGRPGKANQNPIVVLDSQESQESQGSITDLLQDLQVQEEEELGLHLVVAGAEAPIAEPLPPSRQISGALALA